MSTTFDLSWSNIEKINVSPNGSNDVTSLDLVKDDKGNVLWRRKTDTWFVPSPDTVLISTTSDNYISYIFGCGSPEPVVDGVTTYIFTTIYDSNTNEILLDAEVSYFVTSSSKSSVTVKTSLKAETARSYRIEIFISENEYHKAYSHIYTAKVLLTPVYVNGDITNTYNCRVEYVPNYNSSSGYGARIHFTTTANTNVALRITNGTSSLFAYNDWQGYHIFVNDGNKNWSDKATMLIGNFGSDFALIGSWSETSTACYYKNGNNYAIEFGLEDGYYYVLRDVVTDDTTIYTSILLDPPSNYSIEYSGHSHNPASNGFYGPGKWTVTRASSSDDPSIPGQYAYILTKSSNLRIWSDDYTRLKVDKTRYFTITKAIIYFYDFSDVTTSYSYTGDSIYVQRISDSRVTNSGTLSAVTAGSYIYYITPTQYCQWDDGTTGSKSISWTIEKQYWSVAGGTLSSSVISGDSTRLDSTYEDDDEEVVLVIYDYPNLISLKKPDLPYVRWELWGAKSNTLTASQILTGYGEKLASGSGTATLFSGGIPTSISVHFTSGNIIIRTGYTGDLTRDMDVRAKVFIGETANMKPYAEEMNTAKLTVPSKYIVIDKPYATTSFTYDGSSHMAFYSGTGYTASGSLTYPGTGTTTATLKDGYCWSDGTTSSYTVSFTINKYTISSSDLTVTLGKSGGYVRARVTASKSFLNGLSYTGRFRKNTTSNYGNNKSETIGNWVTSTWTINGTDKYGFVVESVSGNSNINGWSGSKGSGSWYTG